MAFMSPGLDFRGICAGVFEIPVGILAFQNRRQERGVFFAGRTVRGLDVLTIFDDGDAYCRVLCEPDLGSRLGIRADRLHGKSVGEDRVVANLIDLGIAKLEARRKLPDLVAQVCEADKFVGRKEVLDAI